MGYVLIIFVVAGFILEVQSNKKNSKVYSPENRVPGIFVGASIIGYVIVSVIVLGFIALITQ